MLWVYAWIFALALFQIVLVVPNAVTLIVPRVYVGVGLVVKSIKETAVPAVYVESYKIWEIVPKEAVSNVFPAKNFDAGVDANVNVPLT